MTERQIKSKYGRYAIKATNGYKNKALKILNDICGSKFYTIDVFDDCVTETQVDNRRQKLIVEM